METDNTDDAHSYVFGLSDAGQPLWRIETGGPFTQAHLMLTDFEGDGVQEIVAWVYYGMQRRSVKELSAHWEKGEVFRLSQAGTIVGHFEVPHQLMSCLSADLDRDGKRELLVTDRLGNLYCLDSGLSLQRTVNVVSNRYDQVDLLVVAAQDLDNDGQLEIVLQYQHQQYGSGENPGRPNGEFNMRTSHEPTVIVLDARLQTICRYVLEDKWQGNWRGFSVAVADLDNDKASEIIVFADRAEVLSFLKW